LAIISASGMCDSGRITHHLKHHLWKANTHVIFVGFQAEGTLGRLLVDGAKKIKIHGETIEVNAKIHTIGGLSAHADREQLMSWLKFYVKSNPKVFLIHGEPDVCKEFSGNISENFNLETFIPEWGDTAEIIFKEKAVDIKFRINAFKSNFNEEKTHWYDLINHVNNKIKESEYFEPNRKSIFEDFLRETNEFIKQNLDNKVNLK